MKGTLPRWRLYPATILRQQFYYRSCKPSFSIIDNADYDASHVRISGGIYKLTF